MAKIEEIEEETEDEKEIVVKWANYYSSFHSILLVGEGDFSFSLCLANAFGSASNMVATSLDSHGKPVFGKWNAEEKVENSWNLKSSYHDTLCLRFQELSPFPSKYHLSNTT